MFYVKEKKKNGIYSRSILGQVIFFFLFKGERKHWAPYGWFRFRREVTQWLHERKSKGLSYTECAEDEESVCDQMV